MWSIECDACTVIGCGHVVGYVLEGSVVLVVVIGDWMGWDQVKSVTIWSGRSGFGRRAGGSHAGWVGVIE